MHKNSLFAVLLRSPWWVSFAVAGGVFALTRAVLPDASPLVAAFGALPFAAIGGYAAWRQLRAPGAAQVAAALDALRAQSWEEFSAALSEAFRRDGYAVARLDVPGADLELTRAGRVTLVGCKRWKAARAGIEPLRELEAAREKRAAHECIYVVAADVSDNAQAFAAEKRIRLLRDAELAGMILAAKR